MHQRTMPSKPPVYLKPNSERPGSTNGRSGKKLREILSSEMISLPLGDFRHTAHVGKGEDDIFGDTTFLQQKTNKPDIVITRGSLRRSGKGSKKHRYDRDKPDRRPLSNQSYDGYGPSESPILQSAISLPMLNQPSSLSTPKVLSEIQETKAVKKAAKKNTNNNSMSYHKAKSHETGLNCLSVAPEDSSTPYQRSPSAPTDNFNKKPHKTSLDSVGESETSRSSATLVEKSPTTSLMTSLPGDTTSIDESWTFDLDLGKSLMDEIMLALDKTNF